MSRKKLAVFVAVHTYPEVAKLTIGSFLRAHPGYEIEVHVGCHSNYGHYCQDLSLFNDLRGLAQIHLVDEIDWLGAYNACWYRYSVMHAKNLENLLKQAQYSSFDQAVILDHDLCIKENFVTAFNETFPDADLIGSMFEDRAGLKPYDTAHQEKVYSSPKISVWHTMVSRKLYEQILKNPGMIYPKIVPKTDRKYLDVYKPDEDRPVFVDTFADVYHLVVHGKAGFKAGIVGSTAFQEYVDHFYNSSFNYGYWTRGQSYPNHVKDIVNRYHAEFPKGLSEFH